MTSKILDFIFLAANADDDDVDSACLKTLNLETEVDEPIGELSGGQKRRVAIALALQRQPQLLLLDEPTAGLDPATETEVMLYLQRLARQGRTVLCATHVMENLQLFDKVLVLTGGEENGKSVYFGTPAGLLEHFGVSSYPDMYIKLRDESKSLAVLRNENSSTPEPWALPEAPRPASFLRTVGGYLSRWWKEFAAAFIRSKRWDLIRQIWLVLLQPALIAIGINCACADKFLTSPVGGGTGVVIVLFCAGLSVFWLGLVGCAQSFVRERIPGRCLERLGGVSVLRYGVAKLLTSIGCCFVKVLVFAFLLFNLDGWIKWIGGSGFLAITENDPSYLSWSWGVVWTLFFLCVMGGVVGLAVSSICRKATTAVAIVPIIAVLALFFSQPVIQFKTDSIKGEKSAGYSNVRVDFSEDASKGLNKFAICLAEWCMPCHKAQVLMTVMNEQANGKHRVFSKDELFSNGEQRKKNAEFNVKLGRNVRNEFLKVLGGYVFICILFAMVGQWWREHEWNGR